MKSGQLVFFSCGGNVNLYAKVATVSENKTTFDIINGGYTLTVHSVTPPDNVRGDYNAVMDWYKQTHLKGR